MLITLLLNAVPRLPTLMLEITLVYMIDISGRWVFQSAHNRAIIVNEKYHQIFLTTMNTVYLVDAHVCGVHEATIDHVGKR